MIQIAIAGNIGSGKTTLTSLLAKRLKWKANFENPERNPYINDFYCDMSRWSFNMQVSFLYSRLKQVVDVRAGSENTVQDRTIYEDASIFAPNLYDMGLLDYRDFSTYNELFKIAVSLVEPPDLIIYINASVETLVNQIASRGREYEMNISSEYLGNLNKKYNKWAQEYNMGKILVVDIDKLNFLTSTENFETLLDMICQELGIEKPKKRRR